DRETQKAQSERRESRPLRAAPRGADAATAAGVSRGGGFGRVRRHDGTCAGSAHDAAAPAGARRGAATGTCRGRTRAAGARARRASVSSNALQSWAPKIARLKCRWTFPGSLPRRPLVLDGADVRRRVAIFAVEIPEWRLGRHALVDARGTIGDAVGI